MKIGQKSQDVVRVCENILRTSQKMVIVMRVCSHTLEIIFGRFVHGLESYGIENSEGALWAELWPFPEF